MIQTFCFINLITTGLEWKTKMQYMKRKGTWVEVIFIKHQIKQIIESCLNNPTAGQIGSTQTFYKVSEHFYLPRIFKDVEKLYLNHYIVLDIY